MHSIYSLGLRLQAPGVVQASGLQVVPESSNDQTLQVGLKKGAAIQSLMMVIVLYLVCLVCTHHMLFHKSIFPDYTQGEHSTSIMRIW
jgi:hypothetical protein